MRGSGVIVEATMVSGQWLNSQYSLLQQLSHILFIRFPYTRFSTWIDACINGKMPLPSEVLLLKALATLVLAVSVKFAPMFQITSFINIFAE